MIPIFSIPKIKDRQETNVIELAAYFNSQPLNQPQFLEYYIMKLHPVKTHLFVSLPNVEKPTVAGATMYKILGGTIKVRLQRRIDDVTEITRPIETQRKLNDFLEQQLGFKDSDLSVYPTVVSYTDEDDRPLDVSVMEHFKQAMLSGRTVDVSSLRIFERKKPKIVLNAFPIYEIEEYEFDLLELENLTIKRKYSTFARKGRENTFIYKSPFSGVSEYLILSDDKGIKLRIQSWVEDASLQKIDRKRRAVR